MVWLPGFGSRYVLKPMRIHNTLIRTRPRKLESDGCIAWIVSLSKFANCQQRRVADPHHLNAYPDPDFYFNGDSDVQVIFTLMRIRISNFKKHGSTRIRISKWTIWWIGDCFVLKPCCGLRHASCMISC